MEVVYTLLVIGLIAGIRLYAGRLDRQRIADYLKERNRTLLKAIWAPTRFGGWSEDCDRIYEIRYRDEHGTEYLATCKTSYSTGVFFTEEFALPSTRRDDRAAELEAENRRLRDELDKLKNKTNTRSS